MSLENELARIATAFERIADSLEKPANPLMTIAPTPFRAEDIVGKKLAEEITAPFRVAEEQGPLATPVAPVAPASPVISPVANAETLPTTAKELLELAQDVASKLGEKVPAFTEWCKASLLPKYNVDKIKLIPQTEVALAAKEIIGYAGRMGIKV